MVCVLSPGSLGVQVLGSSAPRCGLWPWLCHCVTQFLWPPTCPCCTSKVLRLWSCKFRVQQALYSILTHPGWKVLLENPMIFLKLFHVHGLAWWLSWPVFSNGSWLFLCSNLFASGREALHKAWLWFGDKTRLPSCVSGTQEQRHCKPELTLHLTPFLWRR